MRLKQLHESERRRVRQQLRRIRMLLKYAVDSGYRCVESWWRPGDSNCICQVYAVVRKPEEWPMSAVHRYWVVDDLCVGHAWGMHEINEELTALDDIYLVYPAAYPNKLCRLCRTATNLQCTCGYVCAACREKAESEPPAPDDIFAVDTKDSWGKALRVCPTCKDEISSYHKLWWEIPEAKIAEGLADYAGPPLHPAKNVNWKVLKAELFKLLREPKV